MTHFAPLDIFGLGHLVWRGQVMREALADWARLELIERAERVLDRRGECGGWCRVQVARDAAGRWWAGYSWACHAIGDGAVGGSASLDSHRGATREEALAKAAASLLASMRPDITRGRAGRILTRWRADITALPARETTNA